MAPFEAMFDVPVCIFVNVREKVLFALLQPDYVSSYEKIPRLHFQKQPGHFLLLQPIGIRTSGTCTLRKILFARVGISATGSMFTLQHLPFS